MLKLKEFRRKSKMNQEEVATKLGVSQSCYSLWEVGKREPSSKQITQLCVIFECTPNDLLDFKTQYQIIMNETYHSKK